MNNNDKIKKSIVESIVVISVMALYIVYGIHSISLLMLFIPLPFIVLGVRNGIYTNLISIVAASLIVGILLGFTSGASLILIFAPLSLAINYCIGNRKNSTETILFSTAAFFLSFIMFMFLEMKISNLNFATHFENILTQYMSIQVDMFKEMGATNSQILQIRDFLESTYKAIIVLIPSLIGIFSLIIGYINLFFSSIVLRKMGYGTVSLQRFSRFKLPNNIIPGIGIMLLAAFIIKRMGIGYYEALLLNLTFLIGFVFFIQGLAVLDFLLVKSKAHLIFRILILSINIIFVPMSSVLFFLGLIDSILDIRKIRKQRSR